MNQLLGISPENLESLHLVENAYVFEDSQLQSEFAHDHPSSDPAGGSENLERSGPRARHGRPASLDERVVRILLKRRSGHQADWSSSHHS